MKRYLVLSVFLPLSLIMTSVSFAADDLKITRDKDGTTWSVGSDESREKRQAEEEHDKDRAWDMLQNSNIILDKRTTK